MPSIFDKNNPDGIYPALAELEKRLGLPTGFCEGLRNEDDWSFIIKLHALLEAALTTLLAAKVGQELRSTFARLEMSRADTGKVAFAKALGLLVQEERRFIRELSELRNELVHSVERITFNLSDYVAKLDPSQLDSFARTFALFGLWSEKDGPVPNFQVVRKYAREHPKSLMWEAGVGLLGGVISMQIEKTELEKKIAGEHQRLMTLFREAQSTGQAPPEG